MTIIERQGKNWKHLMLVSDRRLVIVEMTPALFGWNIGKTTVQGVEEWLGMDEAAIVAWKMRNDDIARIVRDEELTPEFRAKLESLK